MFYSGRTYPVFYSGRAYSVCVFSGRTYPVCVLLRKNIHSMCFGGFILLIFLVLFGVFSYTTAKHLRSYYGMAQGRKLTENVCQPTGLATSKTFQS